MPPIRGGASQFLEGLTERLSLSAHQAAEPLTLAQIILNRNGASASTCAIATAK